MQLFQRGERILGAEGRKITQISSTILPQMHAVINTLRFKQSVDPALFVRAERELADRMRAIEGFQGFRIVQVADDQVMMVIFADTAECLDRMASDLGNSWMGANVAPLLDGPPDRRIGQIIASVSA
jgi:hypothetical protein